MAQGLKVDEVKGHMVAISCQLTARSQSSISFSTEAHTCAEHARNVTCMHAQAQNLTRASDKWKYVVDFFHKMRTSYYYNRAQAITFTDKTHTCLKVQVP